MSERRSPEERLRDKEIVSDLICQGWSYNKIAQYMELSVPTIMRDANAIKAEWQERSAEHRNIYVQKELRRLDMLDRENWAAWEHSKKPEVTITEDIGEGPPRSRSRVEQQMEEAIGGTAVSTRSQTKTKTQSGNPVFLSNIYRNIEQRCKLLGLYPEDLPEKLKEAEQRIQDEDLQPDDPAIALFERIAGVKYNLEEAIEAAIG